MSGTWTSSRLLLGGASPKGSKVGAILHNRGDGMKAWGYQQWLIDQRWRQIKGQRATSNDVGLEIPPIPISFTFKNLALYNPQPYKLVLFCPRGSRLMSPLLISKFGGIINDSIATRGPAGSTDRSWPPAGGVLPSGGGFRRCHAHTAKVPTQVNR